MEQCPQCGTERVMGENFCDNCGHKYAPETEPQQPEPQQPEPQQPEPQQPEPQQPEPQPIQSGRLSILDSNGAEAISIQFDDVPKAIGRQDVSDFVTFQGKDPLQVSRKQCTIFKEGDDYYIEDGVTSVQDKPSGNHTTVNGQDITGKGKIKLVDNDRIVLATLVEATFRLAASGGYILD